MPGPDDEIRCLSLGETLGKTLYIFFNRADVFLTLALMVTLPVFLSTVLFLSSLAGVNNDTDPWEYLSLHWPSLLSYLLFQGLLSVVLYFSCEAAMVRAAAEIHAGRSPEWYPCMGQGFGQFSSLVCARLLVWFLLLSTLALDVGLCVALAESAPMMSNRYVLVTLLSIAYLGASFTLWTTTMILYPVIIVEKKGPVAALRRSFELARGLRCYFFCSALCLWIIKLFVVALLQNIFLSSNVASLISVAGVAITSMGSLVGLPLFTILSTVMYMSARARLEDNYTRRDLIHQLFAAEESSTADDPSTPLLLAAAAEEEGGKLLVVPPMAETVLLVDDSADDETKAIGHVPEASEVV